MALLPDAERFATWADAMRRFPGTTTLSKAEMRATVDAIDDLLDSGSFASTFNSALPLAARTGLNAKQKAFMLMCGIARRCGVL